MASKTSNDVVKYSY